jgi:hypothetical protein
MHGRELPENKLTKKSWRKKKEKMLPAVKS